MCRCQPLALSIRVWSELDFEIRLLSRRWIRLLVGDISSKRFLDDAESPGASLPVLTQVREALRSSPENRIVTRERASEMVRRAYLSVFNREPDAGAQAYVNRVMRDGWTEEDVARELRRSPEYRQGRSR